MPAHLDCLNPGALAAVDAGEVRGEQDDVGNDLDELGVDRDGGADARQQAVVTRLRLGSFVHLRRRRRSRAIIGRPLGPSLPLHLLPCQ